MADSQFIEVVAFGGYDKKQVDSHLDKLYEQITDLRNKLRQAEIQLDEYKKGADDEKAQQTVLNEERAKLTKIQVENKTLSDKLRNAEDANKKLTTQVESLTAQLTEITAKYSEAEEKVKGYEAGDDPAALSAVFIEAQKSANMLVEKSRKDIDDMKKKSESAAEQAIAAANNKAKKIVYEAEKQAAEIIAEAKNNSEKMNAASGNLRTIMVDDVEKLSEEFIKVKEAIEAFRKIGIEKVESAQKLLKKTDSKLKENGVPVFTDPKKIEPEYPAEPEYEEIEDEDKQEQNDELNKLMEMALAIDEDKGKKESGAESKNEPKPDKKEKSSGGAMTLDELMAQAEALNK